MMIAYLVGENRDDYDCFTECYLYDSKDKAFDKYVEECRYYMQNHCRFCANKKDAKELENEFDSHMEKMKERWTNWDTVNIFNECGLEYHAKGQLYDTDDVIYGKGTHYPIWDDIALSIIEIG